MLVIRSFCSIGEEVNIKGKWTLKNTVSSLCLNSQGTKGNKQKEKEMESKCTSNVVYFMSLCSLEVLLIVR